MTDEKLLPCPFCGSEVRLKRCLNLEEYRVGHLHDFSCPIVDTEWFQKEKEAIDTWNKRTPIKNVSKPIIKSIPDWSRLLG